MRELLEALEGLARRTDEPDVEPRFSISSRRPYADTRDYKLPGGNPLRRAHATACRRAGIVNFTVHDWRHPLGFVVRHVRHRHRDRPKNGRLEIAADA